LPKRQLKNLEYLVLLLKDHLNENKQQIDEISRVG